MRYGSAEREKSRRFTLALPILLWVLVVGISIYGYFVMRGWVDQDKIVESLWPYHDRMTAVLYKKWETREYKVCSAVNGQTGYVLLKCEEVDASRDGGILR
jgi:uncharacterized membrane protein